MRILLLAAAALFAAVPAAHAATPAEGEVSAADPKVSWSGEAYGQPFKFGPEFQTHDLCIAPFCDSFALTVTEPGHLRVNLSAPTSAGYTDVVVTMPDGTSLFFAGSEDQVAHQLTDEDAPTGTYHFDIWPNELPVAYNGLVRGDAELCVAPIDECFLPPVEEEEEEL